MWGYDLSLAWPQNWWKLSMLFVVYCQADALPWSWSTLTFLLQEWCLCWGRWECASWCLCCGGGDEEETPPALCHPHQGPYNLPEDPLQEVSYIDIHRYIAASFQLIQCKQLQDDCSHTGSTFEYEKRMEKYLLFGVPMVRVYYRTYHKNSINASLDFMFTVYTAMLEPG